ncbi:MAG: helix-turn-helix domain-containing protein [Oscillospiraceae bacterium]|nr:helix-turn-helix domain-containing protein [Oscillospiraceae bacterium]
MDINYVAIGFRIHTFRKAMHITQLELGEHAHVEPSNISHIERGATKVSLPTLVRIANVLHVSLDDLVYDSIENNRGVSVRELNDVLADCTDSELKIIAETTTFIKKLLRKQ